MRGLYTLSRSILRSVGALARRLRGASFVFCPFCAGLVGACTRCLPLCLLDPPMEPPGAQMGLLGRLQIR